MLTSNNGNGAGGQYNRRYVRIILDVKVSNGIKIVIGSGGEGRGASQLSASEQDSFRSIKL